MKKIICMTLAAVMAAVLFVGCGTASSTVSTDGSTSMEKVIGALGESFMNNNKGISVLGAVLRLEALELDLVALHEVSDLHPELVLGSQQVDRRHQGEVFLVELADRLNEGQSVFFVSEVHR